MCRKSFLQILLLAGVVLVCSTPALAIVWEGRVSNGGDDVEEQLPGNNMYNTSSDLEMPYESTGKGTPQVIGIRFLNVNVPKGANIANAYIEFACDETKGGTEPVSLLIDGELSPDAATFTTAAGNVTSRARTTAKVVWDVVNWTSVGQIDQTSDISAVIQEIISQDGWVSGNAVVLIIADNPAKPSAGLRAAESASGSTATAPLLHIEFTSKYASSPAPPDGSMYEATWASLGWDAGETAVTHDVYMSENFDLVNDRDPDAFQGNQAFPFFTVGFPGFAYPDGLVPGTTYYWAVDEVEANGTTKHTGPVWSFTIPSKSAYDPSPRNGAKAVDPDNPTLSWTPGFGTKLHVVYFGDDENTVANATGGIPQGPATYKPGTLEKDKLYYWRVDELNPPETIKGEVWSFRTIPDIVITNPDLIGWWKFDNVFGTTVLDWSGYGNDGTIGGDPELMEGVFDGGLYLSGNDYISIDAVADDLTSNTFTLSIWIKTTASSGEHVVFGSNTGSSHAFLFGVKDGDLWIEDSSHSTFTTVVNDDRWYMITYVRDGSNATVYVDGVQAGTDSADNDPASDARWSIGQEWDSSPSDLYTGMVDDARFFTKALTPDEVKELMRGDPLVAWNPQPANGRTIDVEQGKQPLAWSPGDSASEHDVYFGMDEEAVGMADTSTADIYRGRQAGTSYSPSEPLEWGTGPYFWRVDEINADGSVSTGSVWSFSIADYLLVEDFEGYTDNDADNEAIWQHWIDGFGVPGNGAQVGYLLPPYAERTVVRSGQSMPLMYTNTAGVMNSEAVLTLTAPRDWTIHGVEALSIWFRGNPASVGSLTEGPVGTFTMTASGTDIWGTSDEFHYAYKMLTGAGSIVARVDSVTRTDAWAKAGVMIRETLDPGSTHAFACVTPDNGVASQARTDPDGSSINTNETGITAPRWVKLERDIAGNFTVSHSANGTSWQPVAGAVPNRILMNTSVYIGLALTSHNAAATSQAKFSNVTTTGNVTGQWTSQDIGIASNAAEPMYVSLANATGAPAVVAHSDPAAATIDTWTEWVIPLQEFANKGINLANVNKIAIGLGSQSGRPAAGGSGTVYFDDIRLYRLAP